MAGIYGEVMRGQAAAHLGQLKLIEKPGPQTGSETSYTPILIR